VPAAATPAERRALEHDLARLVGSAHVRDGATAPYGEDATRDTLGLHAVADAVVLPGSAAEVAAVVAWCYDHGVPVVPRGGGTGFAGGAVPVDGGVVLSLERLTGVRSFDPHLWRAEVEAGLTTATVARLARENGLLFPPNPGAAEQSQIGGNIATNAGGARAFKYGVTGRWVTGLEVVVAPGELIRIGGPIRKDVAGYDLRSLFVGSEGTLGVITSAWLSFVPAPEVTLPLAVLFSDLQAGCEAIEHVIGSGLTPAAVEYADAGALAASRGTFPGEAPEDARFLVLLELDGSVAEVERLREEALSVLEPDALTVAAPAAPAEARDLWRWRDGISGAVTSVRGGKVSEDVSVPVDRLADAIGGIVEIGERYGLPACSWGHAGDGNLHGSFLVAKGDEEGRRSADAASAELCRLAVALGGSVSGEHGTGWVKRGRLEAQWGPVAAGLHRAVKDTLDPKNLMNPGKKT
jgi:glycolate oxidase subunit GlcD